MSPDQELLDPTTPADRLVVIAGERFGLHGLVLAHPNCYSELSAWILQVNPAAGPTISPAADPMASPSADPRPAPSSRSAPSFGDALASVSGDASRQRPWVRIVTFVVVAVVRCRQLWCLRAAQQRR